MGAFSFSQRDRCTAGLGAGGCGFGALFEWGGLPFDVALGAGAAAILCLAGFLGLIVLGTYRDVQIYLRRRRLKK